MRRKEKFNKAQRERRLKLKKANLPKIKLLYMTDEELEKTFKEFLDEFLFTN